MGRQARTANAAWVILGTVLIAMGTTVSGGAWAAAPEADGPPEPAAPNVVLSGRYTCSHNTTGYYTGPEEPPALYTETTDTLSMSTTGGLVPVRAAGLGQAPRAVGPGTRTLVEADPIAGFGTSHSFEGGSIEDCVRFAQSMARTTGAFGCATSDVHRRQPPYVPFSYSATASFTFVCEGPAPSIVHMMGELNRAVLGLRPAPAP